MEGFKGALDASLRLTLFICLPATAGLCALACPSWTCSSGAGPSGPRTCPPRPGPWWPTARACPSRPGAAPGLRPITPWRTPRTPVVVATVCLVVYVATGLALMGPLGHVGLALAVTVASVVNVFLLLWGLRRRFGPGRGSCGARCGSGPEPGPGPGPGPPWAWAGGPWPSSRPGERSSLWPPCSGACPRRAVLGRPAAQTWGGAGGPDALHDPLLPGRDGRNRAGHCLTEKIRTMREIVLLKISGADKPRILPRHHRGPAEYDLPCSTWARPSSTASCPWP